jgi:hypothetical protein
MESLEHRKHSELIIIYLGSQGVPAEDAVCYHNGLVMAAMHQSWLRGSYVEVEETYIFHKLEIIRAVNESISESAPMAQTGIVEAINSLSMAEVWNAVALSNKHWKLNVTCFVLVVLTSDSRQAGVGEITASQVHLDGLVKVFEQGDPRDRQRYEIYWKISQHLMLM